MRSADNHIVVVTVVTGQETLASLHDAMAAADPLPAEDPAQLLDPDRVETARAHRRDTRVRQIQDDSVTLRQRSAVAARDDQPRLQATTHSLNAVARAERGQGPCDVPKSTV